GESPHRSSGFQGTASVPLDPLGRHPDRPTRVPRVTPKSRGVPTFRSLAISPDGRDAAVDISRCGEAPASTELLTVDLRTGGARTALHQTGEYSTLAGWSPDGRWLLYWPQSICSASLAADGLPLYAVAAGGGGHPERAVAQTLLYPDFLAWCAGRLIAASTPDRETELDGKLVQSGPPAWRQRTIDNARPLSWVSPSCSASGAGWWRRREPTARFRSGPSTAPCICCTLTARPSAGYRSRAPRT
ncbi:MAG: hypothetical protein ACLPZR_17200, partial [Solirubrobacteraceae bacterium]